MPRSVSRLYSEAGISKPKAIIPGLHFWDGYRQWANTRISVAIPRNKKKGQTHNPVGLMQNGCDEIRRMIHELEKEIEKCQR